MASKRSACKFTDTLPSWDFDGEEVGALVDFVVVMFRPAALLGTKVDDEAAVGVCIDASLVAGLSRPVSSSVGDFRRLALSNWSQLSPFLGFLSDILKDLRYWIVRIVF